MNRKQFVDRAVRRAEKDLQVPAGWWGTWQNVTNGKVTVRFTPAPATGGYWRVIDTSGKLISKHDSRTGAIAKARKL